MASRNTARGDAFEVYMAEVLKTAQLGERGGLGIIQLSALEMASEAGEIQAVARDIAIHAGNTAGMVYKHVYQGHDQHVSDMVEELGDLLWGITVMSFMMGVQLSDVANANIAKLQKRYPKGHFTVEDSIRRVDHAHSGH